MVNLLPFATSALLISTKVFHFDENLCKMNALLEVPDSQTNPTLELVTPRALNSPHIQSRSSVAAVHLMVRLEPYTRKELPSTGIT
jgi:hypothetical protein